MQKENLLSKQEGTWLLDFVRSSIVASLGEKSHLLQKTPLYLHSLCKKNYGVFISLYKEGDLRGCFGDPYPKSSIIEKIRSMMAEDALEDPRFPPLSLRQLPEIQIEISILTPPVPIEANQIEMGVHGLILESNEHRSLFLPKVALENHWTIQTFLEQLCLKAHLHKNAWKKGATLLSFRAQTFKQPIRGSLEAVASSEELG